MATLQAVIQLLIALTVCAQMSAQLPPFSSFAVSLLQLRPVAQLGRHPVLLGLALLHHPALGHVRRLHEAVLLGSSRA